MREKRKFSILFNLLRLFELFQIKILLLLQNETKRERERERSEFFFIVVIRNF